MTLDDLFLAVACPACKAPAGTPCTLPDRHRSRAVHLARQDRAVRTTLMWVTGDTVGPTNQKGAIQ